MYKFQVRVSVLVDLMAYEKADAYEAASAWVDALRSADYDGLAVLSEVVRVRPHFMLADVVQITKIEQSDPPSTLSV